MLWLLLAGSLAVNAGCGLNAPAPKPQAPLVADQVMIEGQQVGGMSAEAAGKVLTTLAKAKDVPAVNAGFDAVSGEIFPERPGQRLNVADTLQALLAAPAGSKVTPVYQPFLPDITAAVLAKSWQLGTYTTPVLDKSAGRLVNLRLTGKLINNQIIAAGEEFSFNAATGEPTAERGFQPATVFADNGRKEQSLGGGMCQVSSTLYNAVLDAKLKVTERHPHSQPVNYVPPGKDATTYTDKDFRFVNTTRRPIIIRAFVGTEASQLTVDVLALPDV